MKNYRTAMGKPIDMAALEAKNEHTRAVGNMKVNARGDLIDSHGKVIVPVTERVAKTYSETVGNKSAHAVRRPAQTPRTVTSPKQAPVPEQKMFEELTPDELEIENNLEEDLEIEKIKQQELKGNK